MQSGYQPATPTQWLTTGGSSSSCVVYPTKAKANGTSNRAVVLRQWECTVEGDINSHPDGGSGDARTDHRPDVGMKIGVGGADRHLGKSAISQRLPDFDHLAEATKIRADTGVSPGDRQVAGTGEDT
jgi:hypothetical protein